MRDKAGLADTGAGAYIRPFSLGDRGLRASEWPEKGDRRQGIWCILGLILGECERDQTDPIDHIFFRRRPAKALRWPLREAFPSFQGTKWI